MFVSGTKKEKLMDSTTRSQRFRAKLKREGWKEKTVRFPAHKESELMGFIESLGPPPQPQIDDPNQPGLFDDHTSETAP